MRLFGVQRSPGQIYFGAGQRHALPKIVQRLGTKVFICADERFAVDPQLRAIGDSLRASRLDVLIYDRTMAELPLSCIKDAAKEAAAFTPDVIMGVGGGSCLDIAKLVAVICRYGDDLPAFYGELKVPGPVVPIVAVPTTAGTGSEATPVAVLADPDRVMKIGISSPFLVPEVALCDPDLTLTCPPRLTAIAGADAMTHAIEAFSAIKKDATPELAEANVFVGKNVLSDVLALAAIHALAGNLKTAVDDGANLKAREQVMFGALAAGLAFGTAGTAAAHAIQYPIGALTSTPHGLGVAALMPYVMEYNRPACTAEFAEIARQFGLGGSKTESELADAAIGAVSELFESIGIPCSIATLGLAADQKTWVGEQAMSAARLVNNNPRALNIASMHQIVEAAFQGNRALLRT